MSVPQLLRGRGTGLGPYATRYPEAERTLLRVLADRAAASPDRPWLAFDGTDTLTFGAAWRGACRVGSALDRDGFDCGAHVGLLLTNQAAFMPAFHGPQVRGGVTVALNAESRGASLAAVIEHAEAEALIVRRDLLERLAALDDLGAVRRVVVVGDGDQPLPAAIHGAPVAGWEAWLDGVSPAHVWPFPAHDAPAIIQYTSGTTKRQKGAVCSHHHLFLAAAGCTDSQARTPDDVLTTPMPLFHVAALHIVAHSALHAGCLAHLQSRFSASGFWSRAAADGATWAIVLGPMMAMIDKRTPDPVPEHRVRAIFCPPPPANKAQLEQRFGVELLTHGYGSTEIYPMPMVSAPAEPLPLDTLGVPPSWVDYGVVDEHDALVAPGVVGEIVFRPRIANAMLSHYHRSPEETAAALRGGMFHTGDLGTYDEAGRLHYRGRKQERLRVRGEMVSAPEVEYLALRHPAVLEAAAFGVPSPLGEEDIKLDVRVTAALAPADLHAWLRAEAPRYMVPRFIELRGGFPKTPSERIEKYKLQAEGLDRPGIYDAEATPR